MAARRLLGFPQTLLERARRELLRAARHENPVSGIGRSSGEAESKAA
jgi:hypothetical protein